MIEPFYDFGGDTADTVIASALSQWRAVINCASALMRSSEKPVLSSPPRLGGMLCLRLCYCGIQEQLSTVVAKLERGKL